MSKFPLLLQLLVLPDEALLKDARGDAELEFILFDLVIKELYYTSVWTLFLLNVYADVSRTKLMLLDRSLVLLGQLVESGIVWVH